MQQFMNRQSLTLVLGGFIIGYLMAFYLHGMPDESVTTTQAQMKTSKEDLPSSSAGLTSKSQIGDVISLISKNNIDATLTAVGDFYDTSSETVRYRSALFRHLQQLHDAEQWSTLSQWIARLINEGYRWHQLHHWYASVFFAANDWQKGFEQLYLSKQLADNQETAMALEQELNHQMILMGNRFFSEEEPHLSEKYFLNTIKLIREKQPEYPLPALQEAKFHQSRGDITQALAALDYLSYHSEYTEHVTKLRDTLNRQLDALRLHESGIPLVRLGNQFVVDVSFDGGQTLPLLIDTGAGLTALSYDAVAQLQLNDSITPLPTIAQLSTANGITQARTFRANSLVVGDYRIQDLTLVEVDMGNVSQAQGLLGMDFLRHFQFTIDQQSGRLYLAPR